jgi:hypothetical protein
VNEERAAKVGLAFDGNAGFGFDVLGEELGEDDLLGEEFGADGDFGLRTVTGGDEIQDVKEEKEETEAKRNLAHGSREFLMSEKKEEEERKMPERPRASGRFVGEKARDSAMILASLGMKGG